MEGRKLYRELERREPTIRELVNRLGRVLVTSFNLHRPHHYHQLEACLKCPLADWDKLAKKAGAKIRERIGL